MGQQSANIIGELWVSYNIEMMKPVLTAGLGQDTLEDHFGFSTAALATITAGTGMFGTIFPVVSSKNSTLGSTLGAGGVLTFPAFSYPVQYLVVMEWEGANTTLSATITVSLGSGVSNVALWGSGTGGTFEQVKPQAGAVSSVQFLAMNVLVAAADNTTNNTLTMTAGTVPASLTNADVLVIQTNPLITT